MALETATVGSQDETAVLAGAVERSFSGEGDAC